MLLPIGEPVTPAMHTLYWSRTGPGRYCTLTTNLSRSCRLVAGAGAAVLGIGAAYITRTSNFRKRQAKLGRYRILQNVARSVGPLIG